jgi:hypothetical protein
MTGFSVPKKDFSHLQKLSLTIATFGCRSLFKIFAAKFSWPLKAMNLPRNPIGNDLPISGEIPT